MLDSDFLDEKTVWEALPDIGRMQEAELRAFARYISECATNSAGGDERACVVSRNSYRADFGGNRALDVLMEAEATRDVLWHIELPETADLKWLERRISIFQQLEHKVRARCSELSAER